MRFVTWANKDPEDETPIIYTFKAKEKTYHFTSEDILPFAMMERIRNAWVETIESCNGVWNVVIYE